MISPAEKLFSLVVKLEGGCWLFAGERDRGYGVLLTSSGTFSAHKLSYETLVGTVPEGKELDHTCRVRYCVNPAHLEPVTHWENLERIPVETFWKRNRAKTHCPQGHPYSGANLAVGAGGRRLCKECTRLRSRKYQREKAERLDPFRNRKPKRLKEQMEAEKFVRCTRGHGPEGLYLRKDGYVACKECTKMYREARKKRLEEKQSLQGAILTLAEGER